MAKYSEKQRAKFKADRQESLEGLAENWLRDNPITQPLEAYLKKVFVEAYTLGEGILDVVYGTQVASQIAIGNNNIQIAGQKIKKQVKYNDWLIKWNEDDELYDLYTPDEIEQPAGYREVDIQLSTIEEAKSHIDNF